MSPDLPMTAKLVLSEYTLAHICIIIRIQVLGRRELKRTYLMWNGSLEPRFFPGSLREPRPNCCDVKDAQVLKEDTSAEAEALDDEIIEEMVCRPGEIIR